MPSTTKKATDSKAKKTTKKTTKAAKQTAKSKKNLLIVESPTKAKTIKKYLGEKYEVLSSKGHIRDLPASRLGVDIENQFTPEYIVSRKDGKSAILKELKQAAANSKKVYLATDPDREGEAIAWHLSALLGLDAEDDIRIAFDEITKKTVTEKINQPTKIDLDLVAAQQARRVLDRIVGYKISPFLWHTVKKGLSAGRVQSVATKMVVDREREIRDFVPQEYWTLDASFLNGSKTYKARFFGKNGEKMPIHSEQQLQQILSDLNQAEYTVAAIRRQQKQKNPKPPFTTSSLQQDASAKLNLRPQKTMSIAQSLFEGVEIKGVGLTGMITYMRTDSLRVSKDAQDAALALIAEKYGKDYCPETPRVYKSKANAQDAHEAIRPTNVALTPELVKESMTSEQYRLYKLIWDRFVASQMASAVYHTISVDIQANGYIFKATDAKLKVKGFTVLYNYTEEAEENFEKLPDLQEKDKLNLDRLLYEQKFTQPPARYTESSLIKALEENGIGRPSTYAPTISTIIERNYVERTGKTLAPTQIGEVTTDLMTQNFRDIVDVKFTADMESQLDKIEHGEKTYLETMQTFYNGFSQTLKQAEKNLEGVHIKIPDEVSDVTCELCGSKMVYKNSRFGRFLACPNYPQCKNTKPIINYADGACPQCGAKMISKKTKKGKLFFACENRDGCGFMTWDTPTDKVCPKCGKTLFRHAAKQLICLNESCGYTEKEADKGAKK